MLTACAVATPRLPKTLPVTEDWYPSASTRAGEEGRVLVEFQLDERRRPTAAMIREPAPFARLNYMAPRVAIDGLKFDPEDRTKPSPKHIYRVTLIFCLRPGHCDDMVPFLGTVPVTVTAKRPLIEVITP